MFSSILAKLGISFFDLKMSLKNMKPFRSNGHFIYRDFVLNQKHEYDLRLWHSLYSGHLNDPPHVWRMYFVMNEPLGQIFPLVRRASVDGQTWLRMLVLTLLQVMGHFLLKVRRRMCLCILSDLKCGMRRCHTFMMRAKYSPLMKLSVFRKISRSSLAPTGLYMVLNLSKRWKVCLPCE